METLDGNETDGAFRPQNEVASLQESLAADPAKKQQLRDLFSEPLAKKQDSIIAVRSQDLVAFLSRFVTGKIPTSVPLNERIQDKTQGWYYMRPILGHSYYDAHKELGLEATTDSFYKQVNQNISYGSRLAFSAAFVRNVVPYLKSDWRRVVEEPIKDAPIPSLDMENYLEKLSNLLGQIPDKASLETRLKSRYQDGYILDLKKMLKDENNIEPVLSFLSDVRQKRGGVVIGFNQDIIQGPVVTNRTNPVIAEGFTPEIVVFPTSGYIDLSLNPIEAIEASGEYEEEVLEQLGII